MADSLRFDRPLIPYGDAAGGYVHGIVSLDPPRVQCDGCGLVAEGDSLSLTILFCQIVFNSRVGCGRRMCYECWKVEGWAHDNRGWRPV